MQTKNFPLCRKGLFPLKLSVKSRFIIDKLKAKIGQLCNKGALISKLCCDGSYFGRDQFWFFDESR